MKYSSRFVRELPGDPLEHNMVRQVRGACFSRVAPTPVRAPSLLAYSSDLAGELGFAEDEVRSQRFALVFGGNALEAGMDPHAACYGGHQFGVWAGQLGDGRAITLGERTAIDGRRLELQLKGAGQTPYSRMADGRAVIRSSVREFLCSEAMHYLGVPTTRALSVVATGESVLRDMFYDGNPRMEPGAIVCRVAPSFVRFGSLELFAARGETAILKQLVDFVIRHYYPYLQASGAGCYAGLLREVCRHTAEMVVQWMRVGFVHGVMNTDNMSILGLTIDYGPYGWVEGFDPSFTPNTTDAMHRRYCFGNQPGVALWNLVQLARALATLVSGPSELESALDGYATALDRGMSEMYARKLGVRQLDLGPSEQSEAPTPDRRLVDELTAVLQLTETDMTLFYRRLADVDIGLALNNAVSNERLMQPLLDAYYDSDALLPATVEAIGAWLRRYAQRVSADGVDPAVRRARMNWANPKYIPRNYLAQLAIDDAERGDGERLMALLEVLRRPYDDQPEHEEYARRRPEWARHRAGCSVLSCSS